jgi:hypothetical protein
MIDFKKSKKMCSDPGSNRGAVEPSVGSLTRCHRAINSFKKIQKKPAFYYMGKNLSRAPYGTPDW